jgi:hypothetical protein
MKILSSQNEQLLEGANESSLSSPAVSAEGSIELLSISGFAVDQSILIGSFGSEESEIVSTHASTSPLGATVTLASNLIKDHSEGTTVSVLPYNQVEFFHADTIDGTKTTLSTVQVNAESLETSYTDTTYTSGYYFSRYSNSITLVTGEYSDPIPYAGLSSNTVGYVVNLAMSEMNKSFNDKLTFDMLLNEINSCLRYIKGKLKRWSNTQEFNYEIDAALVEDDYTWTLPDSYYDKNSNRSCIQLWVEGYDGMTYLDKEDFDDADRDSESGKPMFFTIYDGSLYITPKVGSDYADKKLYMDFHTDIDEVNSDGDVITLARHDMVKHWLKWAIRNITENNGKPDFNDGDWMMFQSILDDAKRRESSGQSFKWNRQISGINYRTGNNNFETE